MAQASSAQPMEPQQPPQRSKMNVAQRALGMIVGFLPWIVYWSLVGSVPFRVAVTIAAAISVGMTAQTLLRHRTPKVIEVGSSIVFITLLLVAFLSNDVFLERWLQPLTNGGLFLITLTSIVIGKPFTLQYARERRPPGAVETPEFIYVNKVITWVWVIAFGIMTLSTLIPPIASGGRTVARGGSLLAILCYWVIPFGFLGLAMLFTFWFPDWFARHREQQSAASSPQAPRATI